MIPANPERPQVAQCRRIWIDLVLYPTHTLPTAAAPVLVAIGLAIRGSARGDTAWGGRRSHRAPKRMRGISPGSGSLHGDFSAPEDAPRSNVPHKKPNAAQPAGRRILT